MLTNETVFEIVAKALELDPAEVTRGTSTETVGNWDSLAHLAILERLDWETRGKSAHVQGLAFAFSVQDILENLKSAGLHVDSAH